MAKYIKRAGIIFFALVISCLVLMCGVIVVDRNFVNTNDTQNGQIADSEINAQVDYTPDVTLTGDTASKAMLWNMAIQTSIDENKEVKVLLDGDWVAPTSDNKFGSGVGFYGSSGSIQIPNKAKIVFDLNGHTLNKSQTTKMSYGSVFTILNGGKLTITDSKYDSDLLFTTYNDNKNKSLNEIMNILRALPFGKITGGACLDTGGGIYLQPEAELIFDSGVILDNIYAPAGGAIYSAGNLTINSGLFMNNAVDREGGAIRCSKDLVINNAIILGNVAKNNGGGIISYGNKVNLDNVIFANNQTEQYGGGLLINTTTNATINNCKFENNQSVVSGAGILSNGNCVINDSSFVGNISNFSGGGIFNNRNSACTINNSIFQNNSCDEYGGGVFIYNDIDSVSISNTQITNNSAKYGGGIATSSNFLKLDNNTITNNNASTNYGGIYSSSYTKIQISGATIIKDNQSGGINKDLLLHKDIKIEVAGLLTRNNKDAHISINFASDYDIFDTFTLGYSYYGNGNVSPSNYFFITDTNKTAKMKNDEVMFDLKANSIYDFIYLENDYRKAYKNNNKQHGYNDSNLNIVDGSARYVLGKIMPNTSVNTFINNILSLGIQKTEIQLYNSKDELIYNKGNASSSVNAGLLDNGTELAVGTGWYFNANGETIYLSILGDMNGDGRISAKDVATLREIANNKAVYNSLSIESKLASMIINKGEVTTADAEIVRNVIDKIININIFF